MHKCEINVQRSRRDVGADRGERPAPVSPCYLLTTTTMTKEYCHVNTIKVNTIADRCGRFQVRRGSAHDGSSILSYRPITSQTGRPCAIGLCTLSTSFSRSDHAVGLVHTPVQHKGKAHLESESSGIAIPTSSGTGYRLVSKISSLGRFVVRMDNQKIVRSQTANMVSRIWTLTTKSLAQLHSIGKRSCSCEAIPQYGHAWAPPLIGWVSYALTRTCICMQYRVSPPARRARAFLCGPGFLLVSELLQDLHSA
jgi:hypothetical protein